MEPVGLPNEETAECPNCHKQAAVIDRTTKTVTTACLSCGETRIAGIGMFVDCAGCRV